MDITKINYNNIGSINIITSSLHITINNLLTNTVNIAKVISEYTGNITTTSVNLKHTQPDMIIIK